MNGMWSRQVPVLRFNIAGSEQHKPINKSSFRSSHYALSKNQTIGLHSIRTMLSTGKSTYIHARFFSSIPSCRNLNLQERVYFRCRLEMLLAFSSTWRKTPMDLSSVRGVHSLIQEGSVMSRFSCSGNGIHV